MKSVAELAREAGLSPLVTRNEAAFARTVVQIDRRSSELVRSGLVKVVDTSGKYSVLEAV